MEELNNSIFFENFNLLLKKTFLVITKELFSELKLSNFKNHKEILIYCKNPEKKIVIFTFKIAFDKKEIVGIILMIKDITKKVLINKKKMLFLTNISHELRTPLFNIQSFIQTIESSFTLLKKEEILEFLKITNKEIFRLNKFINNILNISNFNYKNISNFLPIIVNDLLTRFIQIYNITLKEKKIKIIKELEKTLPLVIGQKDLIIQVFDNLFANSIKFSKEESIIVFRAYSISNSKTKKVRFEIGDYGIGIKKIYQKNIFNIFSRLENETKIIYGNGLGLSITKKILNKHNSSIFFTSEKNEGFIFFFDLEIFR